jgi:release factor glutamine methyltransferase
VTGLDRAGMLANPKMILDELIVGEYYECLRQREQRAPVAYITSTVEFMSLSMHIDRRALIPRPDTEVLVERALGLIKAKSGGKENFSILELCTGSGCIALALAFYAPNAHIMATDLSADALQLASENAGRYAAGANIKFLRGDMFQPVQGLRFDMVVANPPYIPTGTINSLDEDVRLYEPVSALDGGADGLDFYRRLCAGLRSALKPGGAALFEIGCDQGADVTRLLKDAGFKSGLIKDLEGRDRVVLGV